MIKASLNRFGGVSSSPYDSLNLSYGVGDNPVSVAENRHCLKEELGITTLLSAGQVHGDRCYVSQNLVSADLEVDGYDALMTDQPGLGLMIQQADCQGVTLYDPIHSVIAAIHSGWQGSVKNIIGRTVEKMVSRYNSSPVDIQAYISPSLGPCCAEFVNHRLEFPPSFLDFQVKENYFDFWQISRMQLLQAGLKDRQIETAGICTSCSSDYFSYRRARREGDGRTGRCATVIAILP
jgi:YfiH family protein